MTTNPIIEAAAKEADEIERKAIAYGDVSAETAANDIARRIRAMPVPSPWQSIESAPKDGTRCLFFAKANKQCFYKAGKKDQIRVDFWKDTGFHKMFPQCPYTHWMPLPESPPS